MAHEGGGHLLLDVHLQEMSSEGACLLRGGVLLEVTDSIC